MLENESWTRCPVSPSFSVADVREFTQALSGFQPIAAQKPKTPTSAPTTSSTSRFVLMTTEGNPFSKMVQYQRKKSVLVSLKASHGDDSDEESAELQADFIDEDNDAHAARAKTRAVTEEKGPVIVTTTISTIRLLAKYIHLLRVMHSSLGVEVFVAIVQVVEFFIYTMFAFFATPPQGLGVSQDDLLQNSTQGLRKMINRLRERIAPLTPPAVLMSAVAAVDRLAQEAQAAAKPSVVTTGTPHDLVRIKWSAARLAPAQITELTTGKTGYGVAIRAAGAESLVFLGEALNKARPLLTQLVPQTANDFFTAFYGQVALLAELKMFIYKSVICAYLITETVAKAVDAVKWDTQQVILLFSFTLSLTNAKVNMGNSPYVEQLLKELVVFGQRLDRTVTVPPKIKFGMWSAAITRVMEVVVDGYARVKKCTNEGRANMLQGIMDSNIFTSIFFYPQDINALQRGIEQVSHFRGEVPGIAHALNFVNAFYLPLDDLPDWARDHPEFALRHSLALVAVNATAAANRTKRTQVVSALEELDKARKR